MKMNQHEDVQLCKCIPKMNSPDTMSLKLASVFLSGFLTFIDKMIDHWRTIAKKGKSAAAHFVWVIFESQVSECFLNATGGLVLLHAQNVIVASTFH